MSILDVDINRLQHIDSIYQGRMKTLMSSTYAVEQAALDADLVIGAVLIPGAKAPKLVSNDLVARMKAGSVLVDIAIDQGGCFEDSRPTTHDEPTYKVHDSVFYCVANMPGSVPNTSTYALTNVTLPYAMALGGQGLAAGRHRRPRARPRTQHPRGPADQLPGRRGARPRPRGTGRPSRLSAGVPTRPYPRFPGSPGSDSSRNVPLMGELILVRHGETEWSRDGRHTGRTDVAMTPRGEKQARALAPLLADRTIALTLVSPAERARRTAELAGLPGAARPGAAGFATDDRLWEWDYGAYEGRTTAEIREERPGWYLWRDGVAGGETAAQVGERVDGVLGRVRPRLSDGDVVLAAHGHVLRILTARWLGLSPDGGRLFKLGTGTLSTLGTEHGEPVIDSWNLPAGD